MWQARLDKALLNVDVEPSERLSLLREALTDSQLAEDLRSAVTIIQEKGLREGHPEFIEKLWPKGTTARADLEGLNALRKQVPEVLRDVQSQVQQSPQNLFPATTAGAGAATQPNFNLTSVIGSLRTLATDPERQQELVERQQELVERLRTLATDPERQQELVEEAKDLLRTTPKGLETPEYQVVRMIDGPMFLNVPEPIELRSYENFTVARTSSEGAGFTSRSGAAGFNTLASYLFGNNEAKQAMAMTMPVEMTSSTTSDSQGSMAFVLPKKYASEPPAPLTGSDIIIDKVPARLVAAKPFPGIVTDEEIQRQKEALMEAIMKDGSLVPVDESQVIVLQYNSPLTVPWRRRNEVAIVVKEKAPIEAERVFNFEEQGEQQPPKVVQRGGSSPPGRRA